ncbi:Sec63 Brl domain-containing protein 2 [Elsinoe fawcettii]|nr:Sec63 Brl domain-containing protein 2 [Elsinoe fawcettii]
MADELPSPAHAASQVISKRRKLNHLPGGRQPLDQQERVTAPVVRGIQLRSPQELPDRFKSVFPFDFFNAVQSKCFTSVYQSDDNFVLSSPTGSGKTAVFELSVCRLVIQQLVDDFKIVYLAPTKALCTERTRDWKRKFSNLQVNVEEVTGDTDSGSLQSVKNAQIIITTPEKWDSLTRKWTDHERLVRLVRLVLIDEVHILGKDRGAALEAVVSRMKSISADIRLIAVSATVPNAEDLATWLGRTGQDTSMPARQEQFGEDFRPVKLRRFVVGYNSTANDYAFDGTMTQRVPEIIQKYSKGKPIMIFCITRAACVNTAKVLAQWYATCRGDQRPWPTSNQVVRVVDGTLQETLSSGVAFHHAGLDAADRAAIETGYVSGKVQVICCTSTLAVGVNLPCHMVIIKGTATIAEGTHATRELSDMDILQMMGRAGRPQFDTDAVAVIMTKADRVRTFEKMVNCQETLESRYVLQLLLAASAYAASLHLNLIEHLNAEIGLGTIRDRRTAVGWLSGTFLYVRLRANPDHYKSDDDPIRCTLDESLENICGRALELLEVNDLIDILPDQIRQTEYGAAMARCYISFETMKLVVTIAPRPKISELLSILCSAYELREIRFRAKEKPVFKQVNQNQSLKFPIRVNLSEGSQKVSLIIQAVLGGIDLLAQDNGYCFSFNAEKFMIFQLCRRLIRCIVDCQISKGDAVGIRNSLTMVRSIGAEVWDGSTLYLQQLDKVGPVSVRKLIARNFTRIEDIITSSPGVIEAATSRNPPFGINVIQLAKSFPRLKLNVQQIGHPILRIGIPPLIRFKAEIAFANQTPPTQFRRQAFFINFLAASSDGRKLDFVRASAFKIGQGYEQIFHGAINAHGQSVICSVACEEIAGTLVEVTIKPDIPPAAFRNLPGVSTPETSITTPGVTKLASGGAKVRSRQHSGQTNMTQDTDYGDGNIADNDLTAAELYNGFQDIEEVDARRDQKSTRFNETGAAIDGTEVWQPVQLANGKWKCNHNCKNRQACNHKCCVHGTKKAPKPPKAVKKIAANTQPNKQATGTAKGQMKISFDASPDMFQLTSMSTHPEQVDLTRFTPLEDDQTTLGMSEAWPHSINKLQELDNTTSADRKAVLAKLSPSFPRHRRFDSDKKDDAADTIEDFEDFDDAELQSLDLTADQGRLTEPLKKAWDASPINDEPAFSSSSGVIVSTMRNVRHPETMEKDDSDEELLNAALIGAEDSYLLTSPRRQDHFTSGDIPTDQPTSYQLQGHTEDAQGDSIHYYEAIDDDGHIESTTSIAAITLPSKEDAERAELQEFLRQEFGDMVELI